MHFRKMSSLPHPQSRILWANKSTFYTIKIIKNKSFKISDFTKIMNSIYLLITKYHPEIIYGLIFSVCVRSKYWDCKIFASNNPRIGQILAYIKVIKRSLMTWTKDCDSKHGCSYIYIWGLFRKFFCHFFWQPLLKYVNIHITLSTFIKVV